LNQIIIDASVAAKWALPSADEPLTEEAFELIARYTKSEIEFIVPDFFWVEMGNLLWKAARLKRWSTADARTALTTLGKYQFPTIPSKSVIDLALAIATSFDRTVYDSVYVALAVSTKSQLVTADRKLANALASTLPVKWLGAYF
jgi:predicted nucleic acid-binding protein